MLQCPIRFAPLVLAIALAAVTAGPQPVRAGCGCEKAPPAPAEIRPHATFVGGEVTIFDPSLVTGASYEVVLTSAAGPTASLSVTAILRRDLADAAQKPQLSFALPALPLGPAAVRVVRADTAELVADVDDASFTVAPAPVRLPDAYGDFSIPGYRAAVSRDGVAYVSLDLNGLQQPMIFTAQAAGYPLRFDADAVVFYNAQGFVMQKLVVEDEQPVPGMFVVPSDSASDSDRIHYSRHEFSTYFLNHQERRVHSVDPIDERWHLDGTPHIDHDHLVLAIAGWFDDGSLPAPGATPSFTLSLATRSLFGNGVTGVDGVELKAARVDSFDGKTGVYGFGGDVASNGPVRVSGGSVVAGDVTAPALRIDQSSTIFGPFHEGGLGESTMAAALPRSIASLGEIRVDGLSVAEIVGPGSFHVKGISLASGATLIVDNAAGPVTLYVEGGIEVSGRSRVVVTAADPEQFAIYVLDGSDVKLSSSGDAYYGVVYAPDSRVEVTGRAEFYGSFVGGDVKVTNGARVHHTRDLGSDRVATAGPIGLPAQDGRSAR